MHIENIKDLVHRINESLGNFCQDFAYKRKKLAGLGKSPGRKIFFKPQDDGRDYAINEGGELRFNIISSIETERLVMDLDLMHNMYNLKM